MRRSRFWGVELAWAGAMAAGFSGCGGQGAAQPQDPSRPVADSSDTSEERAQASASQAQSSVERAELTPFELPSDPIFLELPLPAADSTRYASFKERSQIKVGKSYLYDTFFLPGEAGAESSRLVVSSGQDRTFRVYDARSQKLEGTFPIPGAEDFSAHVLPWPNDPKSIVAGSTSGLYRLSVSSGEVLGQLGDLPVHHLEWSPDQGVLVMVHSLVPDQRSKVRFYGRGKEGAKLFGELDFDERVDGLALSPDNRLLAVTQYPSDTFRVFELASGKKLFSIPAPKYAASVAFSPDGRFVAVGGAGLLVMDLLNPARRAFYGHLGNNIGRVRFSPSGDAIFASSYDGRLRALALDELPPSPETDGRGTLKLRLLTELKHAGTANVYGFDFEAGGSGVLSASGDQTVRWFHGRDAVKPEPGAAERRFQSLEAWREARPELAKPWPDREASRGGGEPFRIESLSSVQPAHLEPGNYSCKISAAYKLRDCTVSKNGVGQTVLSFGSENLLPLDAIVSDDGPVLRLVGALREPSLLYDCKGCDRQPILGVLRGGPRRYEGVIVLRPYYDPYVPPEAPAADAASEEDIDRYPIVLEARGQAKP
jgi:hypothetical protein